MPRSAEMLGDSMCLRDTFWQVPLGLRTLDWGLPEECVVILSTSMLVRESPNISGITVATL